MDSLNYNKYDNNVISEYTGNDKLNKSESALANRPLMPIMPDWNTNKKQTTKPSAPADENKSNVSKRFSFQLLFSKSNERILKFNSCLKIIPRDEN